MPNLSFRKKFKELLQPKDTGHKIHTPFQLCDRMIKECKLKKEFKIGILFTLEFAIVMIENYDIDPKNIWLFGDSQEKKKIAKHLGINYNSIDVLSNLKSIDMKFDAIVGNYPYEDAGDSGNTSWVDFAEKVFENLLKPNGIVGAIHPPSFIGKHLVSKTSKSNYSIFKDNQIEQLHIFDDFEKSKYFKEGTLVCWYIARKQKPLKDTEIIGYDQGRITKFKTFFPEQSYLPKIINRMSMQIHEKIMKAEHLKFLSTRKLHYHTMKKRNEVSDQKNKDYPYKSYFSHRLVRYSNWKFDDYSKIKVMVPQTSTIDKAFIDHDCNLSEDLHYLIVSNYDEGTKILDHLKSPLVGYYGKMYRPGRSLNLANVPVIDHKIQFTNDEENYIRSHSK